MVMNNRYIEFYKWVLLLFISGVFICSPVMAATITAAVDRNPVKVDESFQLVLTIEGAADGEPALEALKKDFDILGRNQSSSFQFINGQTSRQTQFIITLIPKVVGKLTIPPISIGSDQSQKIIMTVLKPSASSQENTDILLEVKLDQHEAYVQEQLILTVRLSRSVRLASASLSPPQISGGEAVIERLGDDSEFETHRNGVSLRVVERRYAIFPQESGELTIDPMQFDGQVAVASSRFSNNPLLQNTRNKRLRSKALKIKVRGVPSTQAGKPWLPAEDVRLTEAWQESPPIFKVGEAITRTLTISADGLMASQLPEITITMPAHIKHYSDQAVSDNQMTSTGFSGSRQQKIAIIPSQAGEFTLPEIKLDWWNIKKQRNETLRIAGRKINVLATDATTTAASGAASSDNDVSNQNIGDEMVALSSPPLAVINRAGFWPWLSLFLLVGWFVTFVLMRSQKKALISTVDVEGHKPSDNEPSQKAAMKSIKQACLDNNPQATKDAIIVWGGLYFEDCDITSLADVASASNDALANELLALNQVLYSGADSEWIGQGLWQAIDLFNKGNGVSKNKKKGKQILAPLYP